MATKPTSPPEIEAPEEKARADIRLPKGHALLNNIKNVSIGGRMMAHLTGKVTSGSLNDYAGGGSVCIELEDAKLSSAGDSSESEDSTMAEDMQNTTHRRRAGAAEEEGEGETET